jgi:uncharacterized protein
MADFNLSGEELVQVFANMKALGRRYLEAALEHRNIGFSNLHQLITDIHEGHKKALPCGAGLKMLAVDHEGELNLCHRFTGSSLPTFGNVHQGVKQAQLNDFCRSAWTAAAPAATAAASATCAPAVATTKATPATATRST